MISRSTKAAFGLAALMGVMSTAPVLADPSTEAFIANTQRAIATLNSMQALFARMDARKAAQTAASTSAAPTPAPARPEQPQQ